MTLKLAFALLAFSQPDHTVRGWEIYGDESTCSADKVFEDGTTVGLSLDHEQKDSSITLWNDRWQSIDKDKTYEVTVQFDSGDPLTFKAFGMKTDTAGGILIETDGIRTIAMAMAARSVAFRRGGQLVGRYSLAGSNAAMLAIARCNGKAANKLVDDPFAG